MAKKITAPHSYDPGKGRPKEYLAYLNQREMDYLRSINGNNMERGPRGLPSFPPEDAVGSSSKAGSRGPGGPSGPNSSPSRSTTSGGGGKGPGGPSGPNSSPSRSTGGGGNLGGGGKGPGGPSGPNSSPSRSGGPSTSGGGNKGPGGPSGPNSSPSRSTSSPMGGQGPSFSSPKSAGGYNADRANLQRAQVNNTRSAVKNTPAARNDLAVGGIRTLNVGPMGTPVNVGPRVAPTRNTISVAGGWGVAGVGVAQRGVPNVRSPSTSGRPEGAAVRDMVAGYSATPKKEFYDRVPTGKQFGVLGKGYDERIAPEPSPSTSISSQFPSYKYESPLTPGMTPEDMARRSAMMNQIEQEIRDINRLGAYERTGDPLMAGGVPTGGRSPGKTRGFSITSPAEAATPEPEEKILEVEDFYRGRPTWAAETYTSPYDAPSTANKTKQFGDRLVTINGVTKEVTPEQMNKMTPEDQKKLADSLQASTYTPPKELRSAAGTYFAPEKTETDFMNSGIESSGEIVRDGEFGYPTNADGSPITAEDIANMPEDTQREYFDKVRYSRNYDTPYPLTSAQKQKGYVAGGIGSILNRGLAGVGLKLASVVPGEFGEAAKKLSNVRKTVNEYDRLDPLKKQQMRERSGKGRGFGGGATSFTSPGGGKEDIGSGGKNEPIQVKQAEKESTKPKPKANEGGKRPAIYYKWDLGVSVPSPTDSDYTLYLKYLQEKAAAKAAVA